MTTWWSECLTLKGGNIGASKLVRVLEAEQRFFEWMRFPCACGGVQQCTKVMDLSAPSDGALSGCSGSAVVLALNMLVCRRLGIW